MELWLPRKAGTLEDNANLGFRLARSTASLTFIFPAHRRCNAVGPVRAGLRALSCGCAEAREGLSKCLEAVDKAH